MTSDTSSQSMIFSSKLSPVKVGQLIRLTGTCTEHAESFQVVLGGDEIDGSTDVQLAIKCQLGSSPYIVRNSYKAATGAWDDTNGEIKEHLISSNAENPIKPGDDFNILITTENDMFLIFINGNLYCTYSYRGPLDRIKRISVFGDVRDIHNCNHEFPMELAEPKADEIVGSIPSVQPGSCLVFYGSYRSAEGGQFMIELTDGKTGRNVMVATCENDGKKFECRYRIGGVTQAKSPVIIEASEKFRIDSETPLKAAVGITISHIYFVINGMLIFSEAHNDLRFMNRPLKYLITDNSLRIHEINAHMLNTEIGRLRVKQSRVRFPPNPVSVFRVKAQA